MAAKFIINGGKPLAGELGIQGSKNTVLPLMAACLLTAEPCTLENVPELADVSTMLDIIKALVGETAWERTQKRLVIRVSALATPALPDAEARKLRASILCAGALVGRMREAVLPYPGGDAIGSRPITTHLNALARLGVITHEEGVIRLDGRNLKGGDLILEEPSVTATENTILASVLAPGRTRIRMAAFEPHVQELVRFLASLGARIRWDENLSIDIEGVERLGGGTQKVNPDELEISGFSALAAATRSELSLSGIEPRYLDAVFLQLAKMGVTYGVTGSALSIRKPERPYRAFRIQSGLYPKLGSDPLPPFAVLATQAEGSSLVHDWMYDGRLRYLEELEKMGASATILDPHRAIIRGPTPLWGTALDGLDIRSGMTMVIAGLVAQGQTTIAGVGHLDRGYARLDERIRDQGGKIQRINSLVSVFC